VSRNYDLPLAGSLSPAIVLGPITFFITTSDSLQDASGSFEKGSVEEGGRNNSMDNAAPMPPTQPPFKRTGSMRRFFALGAVYTLIPGKLSFTVLDSEEVQT